MARKNLLTDLIDGASEPTAPETKSITRISGNPEPPQRLDYARRGAVGAMSRSLEQISAELAAARAATAGSDVVVDLQPDAIDSSFVADRIGTDELRLTELVEAMRVHGQQVPVLVRPHPQHSGRYQAVYGHRRIAAAKRLGTAVKALVRDLADEAVVVAQGQENSARADLSFIERASFAYALQARGFGRSTIMAALSVDKTELSRMLGVRAELPDELVSAIGPAPSAGRRPWMDLAELLKAHSPRGAHAAVSTAEFGVIGSDERLARVLASLAGAKPPPKSRTVLTAANNRAAVVLEAGKGKSRLSFDEKTAPGFADFVCERLDRLWEEFSADGMTKR
jgi:ParB family transcriptional regulator, chromosome partitioning protein